MHNIFAIVFSLKPNIAEKPLKYKFTDLSEQEFIKKLGDLQSVLFKLWAEEERVECIKVV